MRKHQNKTRCYIASEVAHMKTAQFSNTRWGIKTRQYTFCNNFCKYWSISIIFASN